MTPTEIEIKLDDLEEHWTGSEAFSRDGERVNVLEAAGVFERLGELMAATVSGGLAPFVFTEACRHWFADAPGLQGYPEKFARLCESYRVPPVMCEVGTPNWDADEARRIVTGIMPGLTVWQPPSPALAAAVLKTAMASTPEHEFLSRYEWLMRLPVASWVIHHHPDASAFRLRLGDGDWHTRTL